MAMARTDPAAAPPPPSAEEPWYPSRSVDLRRWTWDEYMAMVEAGILAPGERVELIEGVVVRMAPQRTPHATAITLAQYLLLPVFGAGFVVRVQLPLGFGPHSAPEPDIAVVTGAARDYVQAHPSTAVLVIEIAEHTLVYDRGEKASLYARAGIPDYWVLNLVDRQLEVCREPSPLPGEPFGHGYRQRAILFPEDSASPLAAPGASVRVADLLP